MNSLLLLFIALNIANVMLQTFKTLCTVNSSKGMAALINAIAYGFYTIVVIYMLCDLPILTKALVVAGCNLVGVYIVKYIEESRIKDKLWKIEFTVKTYNFDKVKDFLDFALVPYNYTKMPQDYVAFYVFCNTKRESEIVKQIITKHGAKYFVSESKTLS